MSESAGYNSSHRALLQAFFARSTFTLEEGKPVLAAILSAHEGRPTLPEDITPTDWDTYIHILNTAISSFNYEIRSARPQTTLSQHGTIPTANTVWAIVNAQSDIQTQLATTYTPDEVAFIRRVLDGIFETHNTPEREVMAIKVNAALALSKAPAATTNGNGESQAQPTPSGIKKDQAEHVLDTLVAEGWLTRSRAGFLSLDTRALMELSGWLVQMYNDDPSTTINEDEEESDKVWQRIKLCEACRTIITVGQRCDEMTCNVRLHDACVASFFSGQNTRKCPECGEDWTSTKFVGESAAARDGGLDASRRNSRR